MSKIQCPKCKSSEIRTRISTQEHVCRHCAHVWKKTGEGVHVSKGA